MKLLNITTSYILILILSALSLWSMYFYFSIRREFYENIDEFLKNRQFEILQETKVNPEFLKHPVWKTDFKIEKISKDAYDTIKEGFEDVQVFEPLEKEYEPYRNFESTFSRSGQYFKLTITASLLDTEEIIDTIRNNVMLLYFILLILLFLFNKVLLQRLWRPFYTTLGNLKKYRLDKDPEMMIDKTYINEFKELNHTVAHLVKKNQEVFQNQKQFIENASHEMQTPLAKASAKIEHLIQHPDLNSETAKAIQSINEDLEKLSGLNKSLLLLSKIENDQFHEKQSLNIGDLIQKICNDYGDFIQFKNLQLVIEMQEPLIKLLNPFLAEILFRNLIKNAIYHNYAEGYMKIVITNTKATISNTGKEYKSDTDLLFNRFSKDSDRPDSLGLGLAIVKAVCNLYGYTISYQVVQNIHMLEVGF
jgi:signal transduction histidine kinase